MDESKSASKKVPASRAAPASDPFIFLKRNAFLQRISDAVRNGYTLYVTGSTKVEKVAFKSQSMFERFNTNRSKTQEFRARAAGKTTARWLGFWEQGSELVTWILLVNPAEDVDKSEKWRDTSKDKITVGNLELVRLSKPKTVLQRVEAEANPGALARKIVRVKGGKEVWTWRYNRARYDALRNDMVTLIRTKNDRLLQELIEQIWGTPSHWGMRDQVKKLEQLAKEEWKRTRRSGESLPTMPKNRWLQRLTDAGCRWSHLMRNIKQTATDVEKPSRSAANG
jgi:hypothetical protein